MKPRVIVFLLLLAILLLSSVSARSRTWYIKTDGTGDVPTLWAVYDSVVTGDTVLVAPGIYVMETNYKLKKGIVTISEEGPAYTKLIPKDYEDRVGIYGEVIEFFWPATEVIGFWIEGFDQGIDLYACENTYIKNCILSRNNVGIFMNVNETGNIENCTFYGNNEYAIDASDGGRGVMHSSIIWCRAKGLESVFTIGNDFFNISDSHPYQMNNFSVDPQFCGAEAGNFYLQSDSACAPGNPPFSNFLIGALPVGCDEVSTEQCTWGNIKAIYNK